MEKKKSIKVNFVFNIILTASGFIFPLITFPYASRILGAEGLGKVSFATSLISYFTMFSQLGVPTYGIKMCARVRDDKVELSRVVHELLFIRLITTVITYVALAIVLAVTPRLQADKPLYCIVGLNIFFTYIGAEWLYKGLEKYAYITTRSLIFKCISILALFVFIKKPSDYVAYGVISIFAGSASNIFNFFNLRRSIILKPVGPYCFKRHIKPILTFFLLSCA